MGGDILVSITADLGIIGVIPNKLGDAYINQHIALIRFYDQAINSRFFGHFFASKAFQKYVNRMNYGGAKAVINLPAVRAFPVVMTSKNEQDNIVQRLDSIDVQVNIEKKVLLKLSQQKSGLMQDLLTGTVQVNIDPV
jgi:type I restriction enzyme, S subunit